MSRYFTQVFKLLILLPCLFWLIKRKINLELTEEWEKIGKKTIDIEICESFWKSSAPAYFHWSFFYVCRERLSGNIAIVRSGCQPSAQQLPVPAQGYPGITATVTSHCLMLVLTPAPGWERVPSGSHLGNTERHSVSPAPVSSPNDTDRNSNRMVSLGGRFTVLQNSQGIHTEFYVKQKLSISVGQTSLKCQQAF